MQIIFYVYLRFTSVYYCIFQVSDAGMCSDIFVSLFELKGRFCQNLLLVKNIGMASTKYGCESYNVWK